MASNETPNPPRSRAAWAALAVALVLAAAGGWLVNRPAEAPAPTAAASAASVPGPLEPVRAGAKVAAASTAAPLPAAPLPAASAAAPVRVSRPSLSMWTTSATDELRKVQLALEGSATPNEMLEAAKMLSACKGADMAVENMYSMRDQPGAGSQSLEKRSGVSSDELIKLQHDHQRRCQVFDAATLAREGELLKGAYEGGAKDSALSYLLWLSGNKQEVHPEQRGKLEREARQTVENGDFIGLLLYSLAFSPATYGTTEVQRQAYKEARFRIEGERSGAATEEASRTSLDKLEKMMAHWGALPPPLSPEQQREADALTERVVDAWRQRQRKGR